MTYETKTMTEENLCTIRLGIKTERNGDVIFKIRNLEGDFFYKTIYFSDVITGTNQDLLPDKQYKVNLNAGDYQDRFFLNLSDCPTDIPQYDFEKDWFKVYISGGILRVEINLPDGDPGVLTICNLSGQILFNQMLHSSGYHEFYPALDNGIYIINFFSRNKRISRKLFIYS